MKYLSLASAKSLFSILFLLVLVTGCGAEPTAALVVEEPPVVGDNPNSGVVFLPGGEPIRRESSVGFGSQ
jgi:hypothetical protein